MADGGGFYAGFFEGGGTEIGIGFRLALLAKIELRTIGCDLVWLELLGRRLGAAVLTIAG